MDTGGTPHVKMVPTLTEEVWLIATLIYLGIITLTQMGFLFAVLRIN